MLMKEGGGGVKGHLVRELESVAEILHQPTNFSPGNFETEQMEVVIISFVLNRSFQFEFVCRCD